MSYLRTNFRLRTGMVKLIYHSDHTASFFSNMAPPTGLLVVSANCSQLLYYAGDRFMVLQADDSTA